MESSIIVTKKIWSPSQSKPDITKYYFTDIHIGERMYYKLQRKAKDNKDRMFFVELIFTENGVVRLRELLKPSKTLNLLPKDQIINR